MTSGLRIAVGACLVVTMTSLAGCLDLKKSYPEKRSFVLDVGEPQQQETAANGAIVLKINKFRVSPLFAGRAMVYRVADLQYESDFYDEWFVAPGTLVTQQVHHWLANSPGIQLVVMGTNHVEPTHLLEGTVTEFYGDFRADPRAVLGLELLVIDASHGRESFFRRTYHQDVQLSARSSDALARGLTEALRAILIDVAKEIAALERVRTPTSSGP